MNQPNNYEDNQQAALVTDLPLTSEQAAQTKAGTTSPGGFFAYSDGFRGGVWVG